MTYRHFNRVSGVMVGLVLAVQIGALFALPATTLAAQCDGSAGPTCLTKCCPDASGTLQCSGLPVNGDCPAAEPAPASAQPTDTPGADAEAEAADAPAQENVGFIPLTDLPGLRDVANSSTIPAFLNNIYKLCIGAAAVLAVLQIMRGGITYMMGDSITEKKEARTLMLMSVVGLLLVLSPVIVFGLIDKRILNLQINFGSLAPSGTGSPVTGDTSATGVCSFLTAEPEGLEAVTQLTGGELPSGAFTWNFTDPSQSMCTSACSAKIRSGPGAVHCAATVVPNEQGNVRYFCDCRPSNISPTQHRFQSVMVTIGEETHKLVRSGSFIHVSATSAACVADVTPAHVRTWATGSLVCETPSTECNAFRASVANAATAQISVSSVECVPSSV